MAFVGSTASTDAYAGIVVPLHGAADRSSPPGSGTTGSLFPQEPPEIPDREGPAGEAGQIPPAPPPGTQAWRKSWRRKWRKGSTYRTLTLIQRELLRFIEDNAGDDGSILATLDQLSEYLSSPRQLVSRDAVRCAASALTQKGLIVTTQQTTQNATRTTTRYVRVNFGEYQGQSQVTTQLTTRQTTLSSRRRQSSSVAKATSPKRRTRDKARVALLDAMRQDYVAAKGDALDVPTAALGDLTAIRSAIGDDAEVRRRWGLFLADKFWPAKTIHTFRSAFGKYANKASAPSRPYGQIPEVE